MSTDQTTKPDTIPVTDLNHFVKILTGWHADKCAMVQHLLENQEYSG